MLSKEELFKLAKIRRLAPWQEEKRYIHAIILYSLSEFPIVAKGGTYLWFFHGLNRFSEDLDFTAEEELTEDIVKNVGETLRLFGILNETKIIKNDRYTFSFRIGARGPLYRVEKDTCYVYIEISRREKILSKGIPVKLDEPLYGIPIIYLRGMSLDEVLSEKIRAITVRGTARDLYDTWYLLKKKMIKPNLNLINKKLYFYNRSFDKNVFCNKVDKMEKYWYQELKPIVIGTLPEFQEVRNEVLESIEGM